MKSADKKTKRVHVRMTPMIQRQLAAHAARQHMTISQLLREIVTSYCVRVYSQ